jgi:penicillin-binding protein 2
MAALNRRSVDPNRTVFCSGAYVLGKERRTFRCWKKEGHGWMNFTQGLAQSCDVYYYEMGQKVGPEGIEEVAKAFGLGEKTGVDLPHEKRWELPLAYKRKRKQFWHGGDTLNYSIGQGLLQTTALQMANVAAIVGNGGTIYQPFLVSESRRFGETPEHLGGPRQTARLQLDEYSLRIVRHALEQVVETGTGVAAKFKEFKVAGKTGTSQASKGDDHAWFIAYAPSTNPKVACAVVVEHGGHGGSTAAPIARDLIAMAMGIEKEVGSPERVVTHSD